MSTANRRCKVPLKILQHIKVTWGCYLCHGRYFKMKKLLQVADCSMAAQFTWLRWNGLQNFTDTSIHFCKFPIRPFWVFQGCKKFLFTPWKVIEAKEVHSDGWLLRRSKVFVTVSKHNVKSINTVNCFFQMIANNYYGAPKSSKVSICTIEGNRKWKSHCWKPLVILQRVFVLDSGWDQIIFEHASLSLQEFAEGFKANSRISEVFICAIEDIWKQKSFCRRLFVVFQGGS